MTITAPQLPLPVRLFNGVAGLARKLPLSLFSLDGDALIEKAKQATGLSDFGDPAWREGFDRLLASCRDDAELTALGTTMARTDIQGALEGRLRCIDAHRKDPSLAEQPIRKPIFIVGQARTGTTILHELMALDPANRVPMTWEVDNAFPPPERATYETDPRIASSQAQIDQSERLIPDFKKMHRMGAQLPQECVRFTRMDFRSMIFSATYRVQGYDRWLVEEADMASTYRFHRLFLQHLQSRYACERWVLKSPAHLWCLDAVLAEYPDACFVQTHRDPLKVVSSLASLEATLRKMGSDAIIGREIAEEWSDLLALAYERSIDAREQGLIRPEQVIDIQFRDFISTPVEAVARIYDHFGLELTDDVRARMRAYVDDNPSDRDGAHKHHFSSTGLDEETERAKVRRYQEYFGVENEKIG